MALSDALLANLPKVYIAVVFVIKAYGLVSGCNIGAVVLVIASTAVVVAMLVLTMAWDVLRGATKSISQYKNISHRHHNDGGVGGSCKGGICWYGLAFRSHASQIRFRLP
ncbi:unnamed protein product [Microthlaspi erraticum]|uniref:Uncharacterized protein n=1 Tax=Microthlaspi erraticum TaxID=1685480 RepID=A0A6D2IMW0_9BRAS|nr:unnamed protein product [Microthlaspi erraticum]